MIQENQRHLNFNKFIEERSVQISKFISDLEMDTKKKGHQSLPKSIRRRAMSHNRYRIPRKLRKNIQHQLAKAQSMQKVPKCRKHIRKRRNLIMAYKLRDSKNKWLSTHIWSARRMRMVNYYGYKIAYTSNNKCFRSAYRHFRHNCCLLDISYLNCLSITSNSQHLPSNIKINKPTTQIKKNIIYQIQIFQTQDQKQLICPAFMIIHVQKSQITLKIFFHPIALEEIKALKLTNNFKASLQQNLIDIYLLIGPQSQNILQNALQTYGLYDKGLNFHYNCKNQLTFLSKKQGFQIVNKPMVTLPLQQQKQIKNSYSTNQNTIIREKMLKIYEQIKNGQNKTISQDENSYQTFWKYYELGQNANLQNIKFKVTLRSKYTHKRTNKVTKEEKKRIVKQESEDSKQGKRKRYNKMKDQNEMSSQSHNTQKLIYVEAPVNKQATIEEVNPIAFSKLSQGLMNSIIVFCSNANSCRLWRIISLLNVKVIGRRQYAHFNLQNSTELFPQNYVGTQGFNIHLQEQQKTRFQKYKRTPIFKRPNYVAISSKFPFGFKPQENIMKVSLLMVGKGKCFDYSYICELKVEDLNLISNLLTNGKIGIIASEVFNIEKSQRNQYSCLQNLSKQLQLVNPIRNIIGYITSGNYIFNKSREGGLGVLDLSLISQNYLQTMGGYFLIRKTTSKHYYLAQLHKQSN